MDQTPDGWDNTGAALHRIYQFPDFKSALAFVNKVGELAEAAQHHPDIELGWGKVVITLTSHDAGAVTSKDFDLANKINAVPVA